MGLGVMRLSVAMAAYNGEEYIEEQAREKLGLVFDNEIIFKKKD